MLFFIVEPIWDIQVCSLFFFLTYLIISFFFKANDKSFKLFVCIFNIHSMMLPVSAAHFVDLLWLYFSLLLLL